MCKLTLNFLSIPVIILCCRWILGRILEYVLCGHCNEKFHLDCVVNNEDIHSYSIDTKETDCLVSFLLQIHTSSNISWRNWLIYLQESKELYLPELSVNRKRAINLLNKKAGGSYLLRKSDKSEKYVVTAKAISGKQKYAHYRVEEEMYRGQKYYFIRKGEGFPSLLELIAHHTTEFSLRYPVNSEGIFLHNNVYFKSFMQLSKLV